MPVLCLLIALLAALCGCSPDAPSQVRNEDFSKPLPPGKLALRKIVDPADWPPIEKACRNTRLFAEAIDNSLNYLAKESSRNYFPYGTITHGQAVASLMAFRALLDDDPTPEALAREIRRRFDVYTSVGWDSKGTVLYTGYYTPILEASMTRTARFRYPLYAPPASLIKDEEGNVIGMAGPGESIRPLPARARMAYWPALRGNELVWLEDEFEAYVAHVQGSAILQMPDGSMKTIGYAASNGMEYVSVGKALVADGYIEDDELSLPTLIDFFDRHPDLIDRYVNLNPRFIFFQFNRGRPLGSLNQPVLPMRSIATDKDVYPRACLALVDATIPRRIQGSLRTIRYTGFALDQDTGGAIRAPGRCDIYMGIGPQAGEVAGTTRHKGRLYYLFLKP
jgi:membrane-bound lytic murein transglycosylase A